MNEEEKKAFEFVKKRTKELKKYAKRENELVYDDIILNLIEKLQKENEELKTDLYSANSIINEYVDTYKDCISKEIELSSEDVKAMLENPEKYFKIRTACYKG